MENNIKIMGSYVLTLLLVFAILFLNIHKSLKIITVTEESSQTVLYFASVINPINTVSVLATQDGVISRVFADYGDSVKKGQKLFLVKSTTFESDFKSNGENYLKAKATWQKTIFNYSGNQELYKMGLLSKTSFMDQESQLKDSEYAVLSAEQEVKKSLLQVGIPFEEVRKISLDDIDKYKHLLQESLIGIPMYAPETGIMLFSSKTLGSSTDSLGGPVKPGSTVRIGQTLAVIANVSGLNLDINIPETNFKDIHEGDPAIITSSAFNSQLKGKVMSIDRQASAADFNTLPTYVAHIEVPKLTKSEKAIIQIGMSAQVALNKKNPPMIRIPLEALTSIEGSYYVQKIDPVTGKIHQVAVTPGTTDETSVEIQSGLSTGDQIVVSG